MAVSVKKEFENRKRKTEADSLIFGKVPPQDIPVEEAVLGACMLERETFATVLEIISDEDVFYLDAHQKIYRAMLTLHRSGSAIDLLTITNELRKNNELDAVGGAYYLTQLTMSVLSSAHVENHARILIEKHIGRQLIRVGSEAVSNGYDESIDIFDALEFTENQMYLLSSVGIKKKVQPISKGVITTMQKIGKLIERNVEFTGVNTGFPPLNDCTGGWQPTDLIILAARPSVGKTAFAINTVLNAAFDTKYGGSVAIFSLEMGEDQIIQRMLSCISGVKLDHIRKPKRLNSDELERMRIAGERLSSVKIFIDDTAGLSPWELRAKARMLKSKHDIKLIVIDYLQLMESSDGNKNGNREQEISKISRDLKKLAKDLEIPIIALSQMSRGVDTQNREPQLSDLRESGAIEQDADLVMFLYRPTKDTIDKKPHLQGKVLGSIKKHRNGSLEDMVFNAKNSIQRWTEYLPENMPPAMQNYHLKEVANTESKYQPSQNISVDDLPF